MYLKQKFGNLKRFIHKIFSCLNRLQPRYNFSLDNDLYDCESKKMLYYFKVFGDHSFVQFSFDEIKNNISILQNINPVDLIKIINQEINNEQKRNLIKIKEHLRNNQYKIGDELTTGLHSGDEICDNIILMSRMNNLDIYKIAYNTGFIRGRSLTKSLAKEIHDNAQEARLFKLALVTNNELHQVIQNNVSNT